MRKALAVLACVWAFVALPRAAANEPALRGTLQELPAVAQPKPMVFKLGRFAGGPSCGLNCAEFIYAAGEIRPDTVEALMVLRSRLKRPLPVYFNSPGGNLDGGLALGRMLRNEGMDARVGTLRPVDCRTGTSMCAEADARSGVAVYVSKPEPGICNSACVYAFAGGAGRSVTEGSSIGIHRFFLVRAGDPLRRPLREISPSDQEKLDSSRSDLAAYLHEMGVRTELVDLANAVDPTSLRQLERAQLLALNLITPSFGPVPRAFADPHSTASLPGSAPSWPVVTRDGKPFIVATLAAESRRFGRISSEVSITCALNGSEYGFVFREIVRGISRDSENARLVGTRPEMMANARALSRSAALSAEKNGVLVVEVVSDATAGYPARLEFPVKGLQDGLNNLDRACHNRER